MMGAPERRCFLTTVQPILGCGQMKYMGWMCSFSDEESMKDNQSLYNSSPFNAIYRRSQCDVVQ